MYCVLLKLNQCLLIPHQLPGDVPRQTASILPDQSGGPGCNVALNLGTSVCVS